MSEAEQAARIVTEIDDSERSSDVPMDTGVEEDPYSH